MTLHFALQLIALICLFAEAIGIPSNFIKLGWLGMFFWLLGEVFK